jgi:thymidylate synthase (FAD)
MEGPNTVEAIGFYGGDVLHAMSAWTSTSRDVDTPDKTGKTKRERIPALLKNLADNKHHTPFEKSALHFLVRCDKASHIHIIKHRIAVAVNAESARYKELNDDTWLYPSDWPTEEDAVNDRGLALEIRRGYEGIMYHTHASYHQLIERVTRWFMATGRFTDEKAARSRAKESARFVLPHAAQLTQDVMFNFRSFMHFVTLRADEHAQREIRQITARMLALTSAHGGFQHSLGAFGWTEQTIRFLCMAVNVDG